MKEVQKNVTKREQPEFNIEKVNYKISMEKRDDSDDEYVAEHARDHVI